MTTMKVYSRLIVIIWIGLTCLSCNFLDSNKNKTKTNSLSTSEKTKLDFTEIGNQLLKSEKIGDLRIGFPIKETIDLLGDPDYKTKLELWGADGEFHQTLTYKAKGIELDIIGEDDKTQVIKMISISEPCSLKTLKHVGIGTSKDSINSAYKTSINPEFTNSNSIIAGSVYGGLIFKMENNKVKIIIIGAVAE